MADDETVETVIHGCRCSLDGEVSQSYKGPHYHCPCELCNGKAVSLATGWRHREINKRVKLGSEKCVSDDSGTCSSMNQVLSCCQPEFDVNEDTVAASFSASYSELPTSQCGNLADADPLLLGNDHDSVLMTDHEDLADGEAECVHEGNDDQDVSNHIHSDNEGMNRFIHEAVLKLVGLKGENGFSIKAFEELLRWGKNLHCHSNPDLLQQWPTTWEDVKSFLENIGYKDAKLYWICLDGSHPCNYGLMEFKEERCKHCGNFGNIPFYYLSLFDKVARWCSSPIMCKKMSAHWEEKDHWLPPESKNGWGFPEKKEIWDGKRFAELSYFWDPTQEWTLPVFCPIEDCHKVISAEELLQASENGGRRDVTCPGCFNSFSFEIKTTHGDPRNIAYIGTCN